VSSYGVHVSVAELCANLDDARALRIALIGELRLLAPFDSFAWLLTDPTTEVGTAPIADVPCLPELPRLIRLKYSTGVNRWTRQAEPVSRLHAVTGGRLEESLVWRELLADHAVSDVASIVFRDAFGCWSFLDLWRTGSVFSDREAARLTTHVGAITAALRRCTLSTFSRSTPRAGASPATGPIVLMLSDHLRVRAQTPETERYLRALVPPEADRQPVPAGAYNVAAQLLALEAGIDDHAPTARVHLDAGRWLTLRAARIDDDIAVTIETAAPSERLDVFGRAAGLTERETELLGLLVAGNDTRAVADRMYLAEYTVQDHLKSIFAKTGARSRRRLLASVNGV
jgi:DNA-binding CsgD family transcriptional regulator